jgi:hypothetical protein
LACLFDSYLALAPPLPQQQISSTAKFCVGTYQKLDPAIKIVYFLNTLSENATNFRGNIGITYKN